MELQESPLSKLVTAAEYQAARPSLFPSASSLRWQSRRHQDKLIQCGAILRISGRVMIDPDKFDAALIEIGRADAERFRTLSHDRGALQAA